MSPVSQPSRTPSPVRLTCHTLGATLMATLALAIQPLQYGLLAGVGQAMAQTCTASVEPGQPSTQNCTGPEEPGIYDPTDPSNPAYPGLPTGPSGPLPTTYLLLPGIGDGGAVGEVAGRPQSEYFKGKELDTFLKSAANSNVEQAWADWKNDNITVQGQKLAQATNAIAGSVTAPRNVIMIGHSMGGLRARSALQLSAAQYPKLQDRVKAMVTLGTPHKGAPIINLGEGAATLLGGVFGLALSGWTGQGPFLPTAVGMFGARALALPTISSPSGQDMRPGSAFLQRINAPASAEKLPASVTVMRVIGQQSDIDAYGASTGIWSTSQEVTGTRQLLGGTFTVMGFMALAAGFFTFGATIPWGLGMLAAAALLFSLPAFWRQNVMGAGTGDAIVPEDSQNMPPTSTIGGRESNLDLRLPNAVHTGLRGEYQAKSAPEYQDDNLLQDSLQRLQAQVSVSLSPLHPEW